MWRQEEIEVEPPVSREQRDIAMEIEEIEDGKKCYCNVMKQNRKQKQHKNYKKIYCVQSIANYNKPIKTSILQHLTIHQFGRNTDSTVPDPSLCKIGQNLPLGSRHIVIFHRGKG